MKIMNAVRRIERAFLVSVFLIMVVLFFLNVVIREIGGPLAGDFAWIAEAVRLLNLFLVFCALGLALERGRHVSIDTLRDLPRRIRLPLLRLIDAVGFCFSIYLVILGWRMVTFVLATGQRSPTLDIPMGWIYLAPWIGFGLLALRFALSFFGALDRYAAASREPGEW